VHHAISIQAYHYWNSFIVIRITSWRGVCPCHRKTASGSIITPLSLHSIPAAISALPAARFDFEAIATDDADNRSPITTLVFWIDTAAPPAPVLATPLAAVVFSDTVVLSLSSNGDDSPGELTYQVRHAHSDTRTHARMREHSHVSGN
jgi:hypothetical protein